LSSMQGVQNEIEKKGKKEKNKHRFGRTRKDKYFEHRSPCPGTPQNEDSALVVDAASV